MKLDYRSAAPESLAPPSRFPLPLAILVFANALVALALFVPGLAGLADGDMQGMLMVGGGGMAMIAVFGFLCRTPPRRGWALGFLTMAIALECIVATMAHLKIAQFERRIGVMLSGLSRPETWSVGMVWDEYTLDAASAAIVLGGMLWLYLSVDRFVAALRDDRRGSAER